MTATLLHLGVVLWLFGMVEAPLRQETTERQCFTA
jgi:hypothetical protein